MNYQTFKPHQDLESLVNFYWTLEVSAEENSEKQHIIPDGCIEMAFILGDDIKRYTAEDEFIIQPRAMILGQTIEPFLYSTDGVCKYICSEFLSLWFFKFHFRTH